MSSVAAQVEAYRMNWLQVLRGLASVKILMAHACGLTTELLGAGAMAWVRVGYFTVPFFFILSGYVMGHALERMSRSRVHDKLGHYVTGRVLRVFLPYWPVSVALLLAYTVLADQLGMHKDVGVLGSLTLLPTDQALSLTVAWTLQHEWLFYMVCATWFIHTRLWMGVMGAWLVVVLAPLLGWGRLPDGPWMDVFQRAENLYFFVGLALYHGRVLLARCPVNPVCACLAFMGLLSWASMVGQMPMVVGLALAGIVWSVSRWSFAIPQPLLYLGQASYAVYLVHGPVQVLLLKWAVHWPGMTVDLAFWLLTLTSLVAGLAYHAWWEQRVIAFTQQVLGRFARAPAPTSAALAGQYMPSKAPSP